jgi:hypothetical protein
MRESVALLGAGGAPAVGAPPAIESVLTLAPPAAAAAATLAARAHREHRRLAHVRHSLLSRRAHADKLRKLFLLEREERLGLVAS